MNTIIESIINGNRRDALQQLINSEYLLEDLFKELLTQQMPSEIIIMYRIAVRMGYITFKE